MSQIPAKVTSSVYSIVNFFGSGTWSSLKKPKLIVFGVRLVVVLAKNVTSYKPQSTGALS